MSVRTIRARLGDAASDNINTAIWGNTSYGVETGQQGTVSAIGAALTAQNVNPATATPAQIMSVYSRQQQQNLNDALQAFGSAPAAPAAPPPASPLPDVTLNYSPVPPSPCPAWGCGPAPVQYATSVSPVPTTPAVSSSSGIPTWGWVAIALGGAFLLTRK